MTRKMQIVKVKYSDSEIRNNQTGTGKIVSSSMNGTNVKIRQGKNNKLINIPPGNIRVIGNKKAQDDEDGDFVPGEWDEQTVTIEMAKELEIDPNLDIDDLLDIFESLAERVGEDFYPEDVVDALNLDQFDISTIDGLEKAVDLILESYDFFPVEKGGVFEELEEFIDIYVEDASDFGVFYFKVTAEGKEYLVFMDDNDARHYAESYVKEMMETEPELFAKDFLKDYVYISLTDRRMIALDMANSYVSDIDDYRVVAEAGIEDEYIEAEENENYEMMNEIVEEARVILSDKIVAEWEEGLKNDPIGFLIDEQGLYSSVDEIDFLQFDYDEAVKDAIRIDGVAHFIAHYDGKERETSNGLLYYRTN